MKLRYTIIVVTLLLELLLALTPFIPATAQIWHREDPTRFYGTLATFVGIQFTILTAALGLLALNVSNEVNTRIAGLELKLPHTIVKRLRDSQFYTEFRAAVESAQHSVRICYFAPYPPSEVAYDDRRKYYREILDLMKKKRDVAFKRIIRHSPANEVWIADLLRELEGRPNNDLAVLRADIPVDNVMPLSLSVQVVDEDKTWLVAIHTHEREGEFRDIYVENPDVALGITGYFDRLWAKSVTVLDHGRITPEGQELRVRVEAACDEQAEA